jgi:hypothetical protein
MIFNTFKMLPNLGSQGHNSPLEKRRVTLQRLPHRFFKISFNIKLSLHGIDLDHMSETLILKSSDSINDHQFSSAKPSI